MSFHNFKTKAEASKHRYGKWGGNPKGVPYDPKRCAEEVFESGRGGLHHQCNLSNGHGPDEIYCAIHDPEKVAKRIADRDKKADERMRAQRAKWYAGAMLALLKSSREGITADWQRKRDELIQEIEK